MNISNLFQGAAQAAGAAAKSSSEALGGAAQVVAGATQAVGAAGASAAQAGVSAAQAGAEAAQAAASASLALGAQLVDGSVVASEATRGALGWFAAGVGEQLGDQARMGPELLSLRARALEANRGEPTRVRHDSPDEAREYKDLSLAIYDSESELPAGYSEVSDAEQRLGVPLKDAETGLEAKVYGKDEDGDGTIDVYVLVFEGTTSDDNGTDWGDNLANGAGGVPKQYRQSLDIALRFREVYGEEGDLVVTGHSLGGGLATFAGLGAGLETYTYNPSGLGPGTRAFLDSAGLVGRNQHLVKNYVQRGEVLDMLRLAQTLMMGKLAPFAPWLGSLIAIGETEHVGEYGRDPITAHNEPDMEGV